MSKNKTRRLTMQDIAKKAGVAPITVSRALAGHSSVKPATREKVMKVADAMGYQLNIAARNLRQQRTSTIAVVIEMEPTLGRSISDPYPMALLGGIIEELSYADYSAMLLTADKFMRLPPAADAVILLGQGVHNDAVSLVERCGLPLVVWGSVNRDGGQHVVVGSDNVEGGRLAAQRFLELGRKRAFFLGDVEHGEAADRFEGFREYFTQGGGQIVDSLTCDFTMAQGFAVMREGISQHGEAFDAVFAASDAIAMGVVRALEEDGREIPDDVSVIGFDDDLAAQVFSPPLTTIHQNWHEGGRQLACAAMSLIQSESASSSILPTLLVVRGT